MKKLAAIILTICTCFVCFSQTTRPSRNQMCSNYLAYEKPNEKYTPAPKGYKPFYISHYGRHGSRFHWSQDDYQFFSDLFHKAESANALTEFGKSVAKRVYKLNDYATLRAGDLTLLGQEQHKGIAKRMYANFPDVFKQQKLVAVTASTTPRCIVSMSAFCTELSALSPQLEFQTECSKKTMPSIVTDAWKEISDYQSKDEWQKPYGALCEKYIKPHAMMERIFSDSIFVAQNIDANQFMRKFYDVQASVQGLDTLGFDLNDVFTDDELYGNWVVQNAWWYGSYGACPLTNSKGILFGKTILQDILDDADMVLAGSAKVCANLRFGHDTGLLPLCCLMQLEGCNAQVSDLEKLGDQWKDYAIIPMAGNLQMIFYKSAKSDVILVKVLLNEHEVDLPLQSDTAPYYKWNDVLAYYRNVLAN
ncbi:MAG: histidine-type phosphatase [Bacteroidales bacterium]|nr:histidine-type phosphatase [Bacteroidales bacterium]